MMGFATVEATFFRSHLAARGCAARNRAEAAAALRRQRGLGCGGLRGKRAAESGFTYIGVLLLVAMLGIAVTLVSELWHTAQKRDKEQELLFVGNQFRRALAMYSANGGGYPKRLEDLLRDPRVPGMRRYLRKIYRDPVTGGTEWGLVRSAGDIIVGIHSLSAEEPLKQKEFSVADKDFEGKQKYSEWVFTATPAQATPGAATPANSGATPSGIPGATTSAIPGALTPATPGALTPSIPGATPSAPTPSRTQSRVRR